MRAMTRYRSSSKAVAFKVFEARSRGFEMVRTYAGKVAES